jgi:hypothetical protein
MIDPEEILDDHDPVSEIEAMEEREAKEAAVDKTPEEYSAATGRLLAWLLEGMTLGQIGLRVLVAIHKLRPDLIGGMSFAEISAMAGFGRSAAHNLSDDFEKTFPIRGRLDKSELARLRYKRSHGYERGQAPRPPARSRVKG